jgi:hypothetical protein
VPAVVADAPAVSAATDEAPEAVAAKSPKAGLFTSFPFKRGAGATSPGTTSPAALSPAEDKEKHAPFIAGLRRRFTGSKGADGKEETSAAAPESTDAAPAGEVSAAKLDEEMPAAAPVEAAPVKDKSRPSSPPFLAKLRGRMSSHGTPGTGKAPEPATGATEPVSAAEGEAAAPATDASATETTTEHAPPAAGLSEREKRRTSLVDGIRRLIVSPGAASTKRSSSHGPVDGSKAPEAAAPADAAVAASTEPAAEPAAPAVPDKKADDGEKAKSPTFVEKLQQRFGASAAGKSSSTEDKAAPSTAPAAEVAPSTSAAPAASEAKDESKTSDAPAAAAGPAGIFAVIKDRVNQQLHGGKGESKTEAEKETSAVEATPAESAAPAVPAQSTESAAAPIAGHTSPKRRESSTAGNAVKRISGLFTARRQPSDAAVPAAGASSEHAKDADAAPTAIVASDAPTDAPAPTETAPVISADDAPAAVATETVTAEPAAVESSDAAPAAETTARAASVPAATTA